MSEHNDDHHEHDEQWHQHSSEEGAPQEEHTSHVNATGLAITFLAMVFGVAFVIIVLVVYFNSYSSRFASERLEGTKSAQEYLAMRAEMKQRLSETGWSDPETGAVHIPIEQAMEMVVGEYAAVTPGDGPEVASSR